MSKPKILVVGDGRGDTRPLECVLFSDEVAEVNDSQRATETARQFRPDPIPLDVIIIARQ